MKPRLSSPARSNPRPMLWTGTAHVRVWGPARRCGNKSCMVRITVLQRCESCDTPTESLDTPAGQAGP